MNQFYQNKKNFLFSLLFCLVFLWATPALAVYKAGDSNNFLSTVARGTGVDTNKSDVKVIIADVVKTALLAVGIFFFIMIFYGGYKWLLSRGNEENATKARDTVIGATIGVLIIVGSYAITNLLVATLLVDKTNTATSEQEGELGSGKSKEKVACCVDKLELSLTAVPTRWYGCEATKEACEGKELNCLDDPDYTELESVFDDKITNINACLKKAEDKNNEG